MTLSRRHYQNRRRHHHHIDEEFEVGPLARGARVQRQGFSDRRAFRKYYVPESPEPKPDPQVTRSEGRDPARRTCLV